MKERVINIAEKYGNGIIIVSSLVLITVLTGVLITATGKALILEIDGLSGRTENLDGSFEERHIDGGRLKFYAQ